VLGRISRHPLAARAGVALALPAPFRGLAGLPKAAHQLVADSLEFRHVGQVALGEQQRVRGLVRPAGLRVAGELRLQASDLTAKLPPAGPLVGLGVRKVGALRSRLGFRRQLRGHPERCARSVDRARQVARIDPALAGALRRLGRQALEVRIDGRVVRHERAEAVPGGDQPLLLETAVDGAGGVDVDPGAPSQLAYPRQAVARAELPARDQHPQAPRQLRPQREIVHPRQVGGERGGGWRSRRGGWLGLLCH
jgi:hypothetical protein